jgi:DNA-binding CsgD family transcriptional regulator
MLHLTVFIYIAALALGLSALVISFQLYKLYRYSYLLAYVYYLALLNLAGLANLIFYYYSLNLKESSTAYHYNIYLIIHIVAMSIVMMACTYAFMLWARGIVEKVLPKIVTYFYFISFFILLIIYLYGMKKFITLESMQLFLLNDHVTRIFILSVTLLAIIQIFFNVKKLESPQKQKAVAIFGVLYLLIYIIIFICFFLPYTANTILISLLILSLNIVPILFLKRYLQRSYWDILAEPERRKMIDGLYAKHNISRREKEVIHLILQGKSNKEIADALFISLPTVKQHIYNIYQKIGVKSRMQLNNLIREHIDI